LQKVVLGKQKPLRSRPGAHYKPAKLKKISEELSGKLKREATHDDLYSHLMYPEVFAEFVKFSRDYSDVSVVPTAAFFYGLKPGEEVSVEIEEGKTLFVRLINVGEVDKDGRRPITFELNGMSRVATIQDRSVQPKAKARAKADPADAMQIGAPIPGLVTSVNATIGAKVSKGDKLLVLEAMKMQTTIYASADGTVDKIFAQVGETVESKDLLVKLKA
jgi:pyruvate carboxylase